MVDILFLAHKRSEFTRASLEALLMSGCGYINIVADAPDLATMDVILDLKAKYPGRSGLLIIPDACKVGSPVQALNNLLDSTVQAAAELVAKIDDDCIVPPGWLPACLDLMHRYPNVDLLGIEPWTPDQKLFPKLFPRYVVSTLAGMQISGAKPPMFKVGSYIPRPVSHIGGIGVFRRSAFERFGRPVPNSKDGRYGMTEWQWQNPSMVKAFIDPPLPVFLLDHLPFEPWRSLSRRYEAEGIQRNVGWEYDLMKHCALWDWAFASGGVLDAEGQGVGGPER